MPDGEFDAPLGISSGAGDIFGTTGGVMEATLRAAAELVTGKPADRLEFTEVRAVEGLRETYVAIGERNLHVGVANGLTNAKILWTRSGPARSRSTSIEVMACPGGCIGGGGQPYPPEGIVMILDPELLRKRAEALYAIDRGKTLRKSYENPAVEELYDQFLGGPGSEKAHQLLHTHYHAQTAREASDEQPLPTIGKQVQAAGQRGPGRRRSSQLSSECRQRSEPASQLIAVLHKVQARLRLPGSASSSTPWPNCCRSRRPRWPAWPASTISSASSRAGSS